MIDYQFTLITATITIAGLLIALVKVIRHEIKAKQERSEGKDAF